MPRFDCLAAASKFMRRQLFSVNFFGGVSLLLLAESLLKPLDHDEHQFVASGWLIAHTGLLPYRDFPYFHLPYLSLVYALPFLVTNYLLLTARLISVGAALLGMFILYYVILAAQPGWGARWIGAAAVLIWLFNPITQYATGLAWNHDSAVLFSLLAFALCVRRQLSARTDFLSGLCLAVAIGIRASFATAVVPFILALAFAPERQRRVVSWVAGVAVGLLPALLFFMLAPTQFIFGNFTYAALNTEWRLAHEYERAMTLADKFSYVLSDVVGLSGTLVILFAFGLAIVIGARRRLSHTHWLAVGLSLSLWAAAFIPTPTFEQYFYPAVPFMVASVALAIRTLSGRTAAIFTFALLAISLWSGLGLLQSVPRVFAVDQWTPIKVHVAAATIRERSGPGNILTLAPILPLEAELPIYPELGTGPFAYRVGVLMTAAERQRQHLFTIDDLATAMETRAPRAILLGYEPEELEEPIVAYAQLRQFKYQRLPNGKNLWLAP